MASTVLHLRSESKPLEQRSACNSLVKTPEPCLLTTYSDSNNNKTSTGSRIHRERRKKPQTHIWWWRVWGRRGNIGAWKLLGQYPERSYHCRFERALSRWLEVAFWVHLSTMHTLVSPANSIAKFPVPLHHAQIQFGHCYKQQANWVPYLSRFARGGGTLYDIEFLTDPSGKRVAAFGYYAGYAGAAIALLAWAHQLAHPEIPLPSIPKYPSQSAVVHSVKTTVSSAISN